MQAGERPPLVVPHARYREVLNHHCVASLCITFKLVVRLGLAGPKAASMKGLAWPKPESIMKAGRWNSLLWLGLLHGDEAGLAVHPVV